MADKKKTKSMYELAIDNVNLGANDKRDKEMSLQTKKKNNKYDDRSELLVDYNVPKNMTSNSI